MGYIKTQLKEELVVKNIVTVHYFECASDYVYTGEKHDFWEMVYVDKGEVEVIADTEGYRLTQGEMIFHKPNEFHNIWANGRIAPNFIVISFECLNNGMDFFKNKILKIGNEERTLLINIIKEAKEAFSSPLIIEYEKLEKREPSLYGCEQFIKTYLEQLLLHIVRKGIHVESCSKLSTATKERAVDEITKRIIEYLNQNLAENLTFNDICRYSNLCSTNLKAMFKEKTGISVMTYFRDLKINEAKRMIREEKYNISEMSQKLGYTSIHTFSKSFKKETGMNPLQYAKSVQLGI